MLKLDTVRKKSIAFCTKNAGVFKVLKLDTVRTVRKKSIAFCTKNAGVFKVLKLDTVRKKTI